MDRTNHQPTETAPVIVDIPLAYRIEDATKVSGLGRTTIYEEIKAGRLRATKVRGRTVILRSDLECYLLGCRNGRAA